MEGKTTYAIVPNTDLIEIPVCLAEEIGLLLYRVSCVLESVAEEQEHGGNYVARQLILQMKNNVTSVEGKINQILAKNLLAVDGRKKQCVNP